MATQGYCHIRIRPGSSLGAPGRQLHQSHSSPSSAQVPGACAANLYFPDPNRGGEKNKGEGPDGGEGRKETKSRLPQETRLEADSCLPFRDSAEGLLGPGGLPLQAGVPAPQATHSTKKATARQKLGTE